MISMFTTMVVMKGMRDLWNNATKYATEYYDQLNEIQVVTMKSDTDIDNLSQKYREMARQMSVSSKEIASAATTFYRQGLDDADVEKRLTYTTQFAKVAAVDFNQAAELITATANSMSNDIQGDIQRVVDVFVYLGDNAGTSGQEVATAMQKVAAAAGTFGVSFEWLGAYIATISETTRQAAEVVGTSLNSIISRLHSIRTTGYNQEDETKINDVAKALKTIDVELLDQEGNWRDMTDIFNDIAEQWDTMTDKQKSYIATTIAGVRQQNSFMALMNDLSKGLEGGSRAWELYAGAMQASGTVTEKYEIWEQSVEAANGRLQASLEELYASLWSGQRQTAITNFATGFIDGFNAINKVTGGLAPLIVVLGGLTAAMIAAGGATKVFSTALGVLEKHPIIVWATVATVGITALISIIGTFLSTSERAYAEATENLEKSQQRLTNFTDLKSQLAGMQTELDNGTKKLSDYTGLLASLSAISPTAASAVEGLRSGALTTAEAFGILNQELEALISNEERISQQEFAKAMRNYQVPDELKNATEDYKSGLRVLRNYGVTRESSVGERNQGIYEALLRNPTLLGSAREDYLNVYGEQFSDVLNQLLKKYDDDITKVLNS